MTTSSNTIKTRLKEASLPIVLSISLLTSPTLWSEEKLSPSKQTDKPSAIESSKVKLTTSKSVPINLKQKREYWNSYKSAITLFTEDQQTASQQGRERCTLVSLDLRKNTAVVVREKGSKNLITTVHCETVGTPPPKKPQKAPPENAPEWAKEQWQQQQSE